MNDRGSATLRPLRAATAIVVAAGIAWSGHDAAAQVGWHRHDRYERHDAYGYDRPAQRWQRNGEAARRSSDAYLHLAFATTYRTIDRRGDFNDFVVLGHYDFLDDRSLEVSYFFYNARENRSPGATNYRHPKLLNGAIAARPGPIRIPSYSDFKTFPGAWRQEGNLLQVRIGDVIHEWELQDPDEGLYVLRGPYVNAHDGSHVIEGVQHSNGFGYGYLTEHIDVPHRLSPDLLLPKYKGERYHLTTVDGRERWLHHRDTLSVNLFQAFAGGDVLSYAAMTDRMQPPLMRQSTLLLNYAPYSNLLLYLNGGLDFNRNGVFDESGHTSQILGIYEDGRIRRMLAVEYSFEDDGYPLLAVARYYPVDARDVPDERLALVRQDAGPPPRPAGRHVAPDPRERLRHETLYRGGALERERRGQWYRSPPGPAFPYPARR